MEYAKLGFLFSCYVISLIWMPLLLLLYPIFYIFRIILKIYLKFKYRKTFIGFFNGPDSIWVVGVPHECVVDAVIVLTANPSKDLGAEIKRQTTIKILMNRGKYPKLTSTCHSILGYGYMLRSKITADEIVSTIEVTEDSDTYSKTYEEIISDYSKNDLPLDDTFMWQVVIIKAPNSWKIKNNLKEDQHLLLFRIHHSIGDGASILSNLVNIFSDKPANLLDSLPKPKENKMSTVSYTQKLLYKLHILMTLPGFIFLRKLRKDGGKNMTVFNLPPCSLHKDYYFTSDDKAIESIKNIKSTLGDATFMEVLVTAISKSFQNYFANNYSSIPNFAIQLQPYMSPFSNNSGECMELTNTYTCIKVPLPILVKSDSLEKRFTEVRNYSRTALEDLDHQIRDFCWNHLSGILPAQLTIWLENFETVTMVVSNMPGCPKISGFGGEVDHIYFLPPHNGVIGFTATFFTYKNKMHISIMTDKTFSLSKEHCKLIAHDIFENIKIFEEAVSNKTIIENEHGETD